MPRAASRRLGRSRRWHYVWSLPFPSRAPRGSVPQKKIFDLEFAFVGREGSVANAAGDPTINGLRPSFGFDDLIKCIAMWAIEMNRRVFGHDTPSPTYSSKVHYSRPQTPGHRQAGVVPEHCFPPPLADQRRGPPHGGELRQAAGATPPIASIAVNYDRLVLLEGARRVILPPGSGWPKAQRSRI